MEKLKEYTVYELVNSVNGKKYIGFTNARPSWRHGKNGNGYKNNFLLRNEIHQYGWDKFYDNILMVFDNRNEAVKYTKIIISENNFDNPLYGYNGNAYSDDNVKARQESKNKRLEASLELCKREVLSFYNNNGRFPTYREVNSENGFSYGYSYMLDIFKRSNIVYQDWLAEIDCFALSTPNSKYYNVYLQNFLELINDDSCCLGKGFTNSTKSKEYRKTGLPSLRWFIGNCPDKTVNDYESFAKFAGFSTRTLTKEQCIEIILKMAEEFDRPLMYDDFRDGSYNKVTIYMINTYWGSLNKMKESLGLEIVQEQMIKVTKDDFEHDIEYIKQYLKNQNKDFITSHEISSIKEIHSYWSLHRYAKENLNISLHNYLNSIGVRTGEAGTGIKTVFDDGEVATSQFEYMFSSYIRKLGLKYNIDYQRNVRYSTFCNDYNGNMDCDYVININDRTIYIEIAGIIEYYKRHYFDDKLITISKSKENYRRKLKEKEQLLKDNNCLYFILFPCDLTESNMHKIIYNPTDSLRKEINKFIQNNVDWVKVRNNGKLDYNDPTIIRNTVAWQQDNELHEQQIS